MRRYDVRGEPGHSGSQSLRVLWGWWLMGDDSPDVVIAKRLLDHAALSGFKFQRIAPGKDGPLVGNRVGDGWVDIIHIEGFSRDCLALRQRTSSLILPGGGLVQRRVEGSALDVLNEVLTWGDH